ncbi:hypothetical protein Fmac_011614 [Flemingia macrophylla]|uniref:Uncharacterized protein n=1 Tax=Flemingia macrophylla TaxID=520843 RepID=A0ABD1MMX8_9FABA
MGYRSSSIRSSLRKHWQEIKDETTWILGSGNDINFWNEAWCMDESISDALGIPLEASLVNMVA